MFVEVFLIVLLAPVYYCIGARRMAGICTSEFWHCRNTRKQISQLSTKLENLVCVTVDAGCAAGR